LSKQEYTLGMIGKVMYGEKSISDATIRIYTDSSSSSNPFIETVTNNKGECFFELPLQKNYTMTVSKQGFVSKIITVDTHVPEQMQNFYLFAFDVDLFEEIPGLDVSLLKEPISKVFFNTFNKSFDYDYNYAVLINNKVEELYQTKSGFRKK
jgi:hypothetical protein